jgi:hypothetical protein
LAVVDTPVRLSAGSATAMPRLAGGGVPLWVKLAYTAWMAIWLPAYVVQYPLSNLLWLCDFANIATFFAIWLESPLLLSAELVGVAIAQLGFLVDWGGRLLLGRHLLGGTEFMFDPELPLWLRSLSLFHLWMVPLLVWLVFRTGYDRRGFWLQTAFSSVLLPLSMLLGSREDNINWVWKLFGHEQTIVSPGVWLALLVVLYPLALFLPPHALALRLLPRSAR